MVSHIEKYLNGQFRSFRFHLIFSFTRHNVFHIHDFRVALKRIRAISKFAGNIDPSSNLPALFRIFHFSEFFRSGGRLREIQINFDLLTKYELNLNIRCNSIHKYFRHFERRAFKKLHRSRRLFSFRDLRAFHKGALSVFCRIPESRILPAIDNFIISDITLIENLIRERYVESNLHRIRKLVKRIKYLLEFTGYNERTFGKLNFSVDRITLLEDLIGDWHDLLVFKDKITGISNSIRWNSRKDENLEKLKTAVERDYSCLFRDTVNSIYREFRIQDEPLLN